MKTLLICLGFCVLFIIVAILADYMMYKIKKWYHEYNKTKDCL